VIPFTRLVDVRTAVQEDHRGLGVAFSSGVDQSREPTFASHVLRVVGRPVLGGLSHLLRGTGVTP